MCPKPKAAAPVSNPANYSLADQGNQFDWKMQTEDGKTTDITPKKNTSQEPITPTQVLTGIATGSIKKVGR